MGYGVWDVASKGRKLFNAAGKKANILLACQHRWNLELPVGRGGKTQLENIFEDHLGSERFKDEFGDIFNRCIKNHEKRWISLVDQSLPDLDLIRRRIGRKAAFDTRVEGIRSMPSEGVLKAGLGVSLVGTLGLAAGWHTLAYSFSHVFPPAMLFTLAVAVFTEWAKKDKAAENKVEAVEKALNHLYLEIIGKITTQTYDEFGGITLKGQVAKESARIVEDTLREVETMLHGELTSEDYTLLSNSMFRHIESVEEETQELRKEMAAACRKP